MDISSLIKWYEQNQRPLPFRQTKDPYLIWISEVIFQQTRIQQGMSYYHSFITRFPDINTLANASEDEVMKYWQGLGYYSRCRNLLYTAKKIVTEYDGKIPSGYKQLLALKGIGEYTAAAIVSIAFNEAQPSIDGNVTRVISRLFAVEETIDASPGKKLISSIAKKLMEGHNPMLFNQSFIELGALVCKPQKPDCQNCPLLHYCNAYNTHRISSFPVKTSKVKTRHRFFHYFLVETEKENVKGIYLEKRIGRDIWQGLHELPLLESLSPENPEEILSRVIPELLSSDAHFELKSVSREYKHILSHQILHAVFYRLTISGNSMARPGTLFVPIDSIKIYALPRLIEKYLDDFEFLK